MFRRFKRSYLAFKQDQPGRRFLELYHRRRERSGGWWSTVAGVALGLVLLVIGLLLGLVPGVPGIFLGVIGIALIAAQFRFLAERLDRWEVWFRRRWSKGRARRRGMGNGRRPS